MATTRAVSGSTRGRSAGPKSCTSTASAARSWGRTSRHQPSRFFHFDHRYEPILRLDANVHVTDFRGCSNRHSGFILKVAFVTCTPAHSYDKCDQVEDRVPASAFGPLWSPNGC